MHIEIDLSDTAAELETMAEVLENVEQGLGADGVGHGRLKPPSEGLLDQEADHG